MRRIDNLWLCVQCDNVVCVCVLFRLYASNQFSSVLWWSVFLLPLLFIHSFNGFSFSHWIWRISIFMNTVRFTMPRFALKSHIHTKCSVSCTFSLNLSSVTQLQIKQNGKSLLTDSNNISPWWWWNTARVRVIGFGWTAQICVVKEHLHNRTEHIRPRECIAIDLIRLNIRIDII